MTDAASCRAQSKGLQHFWQASGLKGEGDLGLLVWTGHTSGSGKGDWKGNRKQCDMVEMGMATRNLKLFSMNFSEIVAFCSSAHLEAL